MAFSGTISQTVFNTRRVIEAGFRKCRLKPELITPELVDNAKDELYLLLSALASQGAPLWCVESQIYPLYNGQGAITTTAGTVDILSANLRTLSEVTGTNTDVSTSRTIDFSDDTQVTSVGIKWSAASVDITFARSDDGSTWTTIQSEEPDATSGEWTWYDMSPAVAARYFRVSSASTINFTEIFTGNNPTEITLGVLSRDQYAALPDKAMLSEQPVQYWFDRQARFPVIRLWPVPNESAETSQVIAWRQRQIMDVGTLTQEIEVPQRWYEAIVAQLATRLAVELPEVPAQFIPILDARADQALAIAWRGEADRAPMNILPDISAYTA